MRSSLWLILLLAPALVSCDDVLYGSNDSLCRDNDLTWENSHLVAVGDPMQSIAGLKAEPGGTLFVFGSTQLAAALLSAGLVDELLLMIEPVLLGGGKTIFPGDREMRALELVSVQSTDSGVLVCRYRPGDIPPMPDFEEA